MATSKKQTARPEEQVGVIRAGTIAAGGGNAIPRTLIGPFKNNAELQDWLFSRTSRGGDTFEHDFNGIVIMSVLTPEQAEETVDFQVPSNERPGEMDTLQRPRLPGVQEREPGALQEARKARLDREAEERAEAKRLADERERKAKELEEAKAAAKAKLAAIDAAKKKIAEDYGLDPEDFAQLIAR